MLILHKNNTSFKHLFSLLSDAKHAGKLKNSIIFKFSLL